MYLGPDKEEAAGIPAVKVPWQVRLLEGFGIQANECPCCHQQTLQLVTVIHPKARLIAPG